MLAATMETHELRNTFLNAANVECWVIIEWQTFAWPPPLFGFNPEVRHELLLPVLKLATHGHELLDLDFRRAGFDG